VSVCAFVEGLCTYHMRTLLSPKKWGLKIFNIINTSAAGSGCLESPLSILASLDLGVGNKHPVNSDHAECFVLLGWCLRGCM